MADQKMNWRSPVKEKLRAGEAVIACTITTNSVDVAAHAACLASISCGSKWSIRPSR
jgi:hypothetical protein